MSEPETIEIVNVSWIFENISSDFWLGTGSRPTALISFTIELDTQLTTVRDIQSVRFDSQGISWTFENEEVANDIVLLERSGGRRVLDFPRFFISASPHEIPLTGWEITVTLADGRTGDMTVSFAPPNSVNVNDLLTHVYSEDFAGSKNNKVAMVSRAAVSSATFNGTTIEIEFSVDDTDVKNGWVWVYDEFDNFIGSSNTFAGWNAAQTVDTTIINAFNVDGTPNTVSIETSDFEVNNSSGLTFADAARIVVVLTDGEQWTADFAFDFRSRSNRVALIP